MTRAVAIIKRSVKYQRTAPSLAVFRHNVFHEEKFISALQMLPMRILDVYAMQQIDFKEVSLDSTRVEVLGIALSDLAGIVYLGLPEGDVKTSTGGSRVDREFRNTEWNIALIAAFKIAGLKILNGGVVSSYCHPLVSKPGQLCFLRQCGWSTPEVSTVFRSGIGSGERQRNPETNSAEKGFIVITRSQMFLYPPSRFEEFMCQDTKRVIYNTQERMNREDIDWLTIPIIVSESNFVAYGASIKLPPEFSPSTISAIIRSAMGE